MGVWPYHPSMDFPFQIIQLLVIQDPDDPACCNCGCPADVGQLARSTTYFSKEGGSEGIGLSSLPSELLESLPPEIRTALAERQADTAMV